MSITLFDATVRAYLQGLGGLKGVLKKGLEHAQSSGRDPVELVKARLAPDMLPLSYQVQSACSHSLSALNACESGVHEAGMPYRQSYEELIALVEKTIEALSALKPEDVNGVGGRDVVFRFSGNEIPFEAVDYLMSFSLPNFYFHTTTAYDILRNQGVPLAKRDFMGRTRVKV